MSFGPVPTPRPYTLPDEGKEAAPPRLPETGTQLVTREWLITAFSRGGTGCDCSKVRANSQGSVNGKGVTALPGELMKNELSPSAFPPVSSSEGTMTFNDCLSNAAFIRYPETNQIQTVPPGTPVW